MRIIIEIKKAKQVHWLRPCFRESLLNPFIWHARILTDSDKLGSHFSLGLSINQKQLKCLQNHKGKENLCEYRAVFYVNVILKMLEAISPPYNRSLDTSLEKWRNFTQELRNMKYPEIPVKFMNSELKFVLMNGPKTICNTNFNTFLNLSNKEFIFARI